MCMTYNAAGNSLYHAVKLIVKDDAVVTERKHEREKYLV